MKIGTLILKNKEIKTIPKNCIEADGKWYMKDKHPSLYEIFKDCKCLIPKIDSITGIVNHENRVSGIFHVPNSNGKAWIVCKDGL